MEDYQSYLHRRHAAFRTPEEVVSRMVQRATGARPQARRRLVRGVNEAYLISAAGGAEYLVRISREEESQFAEEAWAITQCLAAGAPVPEVHLVGTEEHDGETLEFMVMTKLPGRPLSEVLPGLTASQRARAWQAAGAALARVHAVRVGGFYRRSPAGAWDFPDWQAVMNSSIHDRSAERPWILQAGFTEDEFADMIRLMVRYRDEFDCPQPVLCHGDYLPEHIFVDEELRVRGVIDFGGYRGDHPIHDFALLAMEGYEADLESLLTGYPDDEVRRDRFAERLHLHRLTLEMGYLAHHIQIPGYPESALVTPGLRHTLAWLLARGW
jgi:aminoglycoside phosphotransferase (APT) family kinase protein